MAQKPKLARENPFFVAAVGLSDEDGAMKGFADKETADAYCSERNAKAENLDVKQRYEVRSRD